MSDLSEQLAREKERADQAEAQLQNYKSQSKQMENMLEEQNNKKEAEIRKLKQDLIMKEKEHKALKSENSQLQAENAKFKEQIAKSQSQSQAIDPKAVSKLEQECSNLKKLNEELKSQRARQKQILAALTQSSKLAKSQWDQREASLKLEIQKLGNQNQQLKKLNATLNDKVSGLGKSDQHQKKAIKQSELQRQSSKKQIKFAKQSMQKEKYEERIKSLEESKRKLEQSLARGQKTIKQLKFKNQNLLQQNDTLQSRISSLGSLSNYNSQATFTSPFTLKSVIEEEDNPNRIHYSCLLLTKPHYVSPFLELDQEKNLLKIYKSSRSGCFQKSMGLYKHKFDVLSYEQDAVIDPIVKSITESEEVLQHSIIFFGVKKSSKKYLMAKLITKLKDFLLARLEGQTSDAASIFMIRSQEEEKNFTQNGQDHKSIEQVIDKAIGIGIKNQKSKEKAGQKKGVSKPKIRYFSLKVGDFHLEVGTSSFTGLSFRDKMTPASMLNNIIYSKLPDILQSTISQKYMILTLNPIVDLYEDCRNTLSTTFCRANPIQVKDEQEPRDWKMSPARDELNEVAKKKLESIERENEQTSIKIRKLEDQCLYFKSRFDELEFRLKNLLNTHSGQNSYLKKSPVTLSYQKLLKFVHSVQSRTATSLNATLLGNSMLSKAASNANFEKDNEALDAL